MGGFNCEKNVVSFLELLINLVSDSSVLVAEYVSYLQFARGNMYFLMPKLQWSMQQM
jgi:hypothetical protein